MASPRTLIRALERTRFSPLDLIDRESVIEKVLALTLSAGDLREPDAPGFQELREAFTAYRTRPIRTVVFGGGSGLSSIVGGDNRTSLWRENPFTGLKGLFEHLTVGVCTTDDGGSTGLLLRELELVAVGDYRKVCLSMVKPEILERRHGVTGVAARRLVALFQGVVNHRFRADTRRPEAEQTLRDPLRLLPPATRRACPVTTARALRGLGAFFLGHPRLGRLPLAGHCLGNLLLVASVYRQARSRSRPPAATEILRGLQAFGDLLGAPGGRLFPATMTPGQLRFLYGNGVMVCGQVKAMVSRRGFPVERVSADYLRGRPRVAPRLLAAIREADLILFAPGSIFSSLIPILQIDAITGAIRANRRAVKVLAANFWVQEGETDVTRRGPGARYHVSDMIEAYQRNVPGGVEDVFTQVLVADLKQLPGHVLRNYALEGKLPIFLDRERVSRMGFEPIEAPVFAREMLERRAILHHDPERFALAVKTLLFMRDFLKKPRRARPRRERPLGPARSRRCASPAGYLAGMEEKLEALDLPTASMKGFFRQLVWNNRDILPEHLDQFAGVKVIPASRWKRSTAWDKVLGYFDPADRYLKIHRQLLAGDPERLGEDILIGMGEALLGRYFVEKTLEPLVIDGAVAGKIYSLRLAPERRRACYLRDPELRTWLSLAGMKPSAADPDVYRLVANGDEGFMTPGLLFGILYAWYLNNDYGGVADYEMSLIRWSVSDLIPHQTRKVIIRRKRIAFLRTVVFRHDDPDVEAILAAARTNAG